MTVTLSEDEIALGRRIFSASVLSGMADLIAEKGVERWFTISAEDAVSEVIDLCGPACDEAIAAVITLREESPWGPLQ